MKVRPRPRTERLLTLPLLFRTYLFLGLNSALLAMGVFFHYLFSYGWTWGDPLDWSSPLYKEGTTVTLAGIVLAQVANVFACRSDRHSVFRLPFFGNPLILWGIIIELLLLASITYTTLGNQVFGTAPLPVWIFGPLALGAVILLFAEEVRKHCLNVAIRRGLLQVNPATRVPLPDPQNERDRILTEEEWSNLYHVAKPHLRPVLLTAYQLGQRLSEIVGLTWDRVDLKRGFITLRSQDTKTKKPRQVPMTPDVKTTFQRLAKIRSLSTRHVFLYNRQPLRDFRTAFRTALTEAGLSDFRFHDLRHCAATNLRRAGIDTTTAMQIVGHTSPQMWKRYNQIREEDLTQAASKLGKYLQENTPGTLDPKAESL